jgi:hypothetical protein
MDTLEEIPAQSVTETVSAPSLTQLPPDDVAAIDELGKTYQVFRAELAKIIVGQDDVIEKLAIALFARGHALLMGVPGLLGCPDLQPLLQPHPIHSGPHARRYHRHRHHPRNHRR